MDMGEGSTWCPGKADGGRGLPVASLPWGVCLGGARGPEMHGLQQEAGVLKAALTPMEGFRAVAKQHADTAYREVPGGQEFG